jgi:hypothetical protein
LKLVFVYSADDIEPGDIHLALTPEAFQACLDAGLAPETVDDYANRDALRSEETDYLRWQADFFRRLEQDDPDRPRPARRLAAHVLKTPMDSVVIWSRLLADVLDTLRPRDVVLQAPGGAGMPGAWRRDLQFLPLAGDRPLAADILPILCLQRSIPYATQEMPKSTQPRPVPAAMARIAESLRIWRNALGPPSTTGPTDVLVGLGGPMRRLAARSRSEKRRPVFALIETDGVHFVAAGVPPRTLARFALPPVATGATSLGPLANEMASWSGAEVPASFLGRLGRYVDDICDRIERLGDSIEPFLAARGVQRVFVSNPSWIGHHAIVLAAGRLGIQRTYVQHGEQLFSMRYMLVSETPGFDIWMVTDPTVADDLRHAGEELGVEVPALVAGSPRAQIIAERRAGRDWDALPVCYVPGLFIGDAVVVDAGYFEDASYYRWQLRLLDLFAAHSDRRFVWKALPASYQAHDPIPAVIERRAISNVTYETAPFPRLAHRVGRVVTDYASTVAFEAAHAGRPLLALIDERHVSPRPAAMTAFGASARSYRSPDEAVELIEHFLASPAEGYVVDPARLDLGLLSGGRA